MKTVIALRGIPGSGKSTWASQQCADDKAGSTVRINNDDLVKMLYGVNWRRQSGIADVLKLTREQLLKSYLQSDFIQTIIIDNTNLATRTVRDIQKIALRYGAKFVVDDQFLSVPIEMCIERDALRAVSNQVTETVIRSMAKDAAKLKPWSYPSYEIPELISARTDHSLPDVYIFDIDGTLANNTLGRSPYDETRVLEDSAHREIVDIYDALTHDSNRHIKFLTGRHESCRVDTLIWLQTHVDPNATDDQLVMRATDDDRPDYIVKYEMYRNHIAGRYSVRAVFDDRDQVVEMWRKIGIKVLQVAYGNF